MPGLEAFEAPLLITSYAAERVIAGGPAAASALAMLDGTSLVGLGLAVGPLRRPWARDVALLSADDWKGVTVRSYHSPTQELTIRALGAIPVDSSYRFPDLVRAGSLRAVETDIAQYRRNGYGLLTPIATGNLVLWPRMTVLTINRPRFSALTGQQQDWMRQAAAAAIRASIDYGYDESTPARSLCAIGVRFLDATAAQIETVRMATEPVRMALAADPRGHDLYQQLRAAVVGLKTDVPDVEPACRRRR